MLTIIYVFNNTFRIVYTCLITLEINDLDALSLENKAELNVRSR